MILNKCDSNSSPPSPGDVVHPALGNAVNLVHKITHLNLKVIGQYHNLVASYCMKLFMLSKALEKLANSILDMLCKLNIRRSCVFVWSDIHLVLGI